MSDAHEPIIVLTDEFDSDGEISFVGIHRPLESQRVRRSAPIVIASDPVSDEDALPGIEQIFADPVLDDQTITERSTGGGSRRSLGDDARADTTSVGQRPLLDGIVDNASRTTTQRLDNTRPIVVNDVRAVPGTRSSKEERQAQKEIDRREKALAKASAKAAKEAEKSLQRKITEVNKLRASKHDSVREIRLYLSADMESPFSPIAGALPEIRNRFKDNLSEIHFLSEEDSPVPGSIRVKRHVKARWDQQAKRFFPLEQPFWEWDTSTLLVVNASEVVDKMISGNNELVQWIKDVRMMLDIPLGHQIIVVIKGLNKYQAKKKTMANREFTAMARAGLAAGETTVPSADVPRRIGQADIEAELVNVQVKERVFVVHVERTEDMEDWIWNLCADIALRPYKLLSKSHLSFAEGEPKRKASSMTDALELMLQEVQGITSSAAAGITAIYPTFAELMLAFERAERRGGIEKAENMLADCEIRNLKNGTASGRKLNKALAKRVYQVMRGEDSLALA